MCLVRLRVCVVRRGVYGVVCVCKSVRGKCRRNLTRHAISAVLLSPRAAPQSEDCVRARVLRNPALLAQRALLTAAAFPAQHIRSALSFGRRFGGARGPLRALRFARALSRYAPCAASLRKLRFLRRIAGYRARIRRKARNPAAPAQRGAWSEYLPSRRASAIAASCASRRLRLLRLVSPPPRLASRKVGTPAPKERKAHGWRRSRGASGNACADILRIARAGWAALTTGPERILRRDAQDAARRRCRAQGGIPTKPCKAHSRMDCASRGKAESAVAEWRAVQSRQRARANRAPHRPRKPSGLCAERWRSEADAPEGNLPIVERCGRTRRHALRKGKHGWGEAVRTLWRQGKGTPHGDGNAARGEAHGTAHTTHA